MRKLIAMLIALSCLGLGTAHAHETYQAAIRSAINNYQAHNHAAARKDLDEALALAKKPSETAAAWFHVGNVSQFEGKIDQALTEWRKVLDMEGADALTRTAAQHNIARTYWTRPDAPNPVVARQEYDELLQIQTLDAGTKTMAMWEVGETYYLEKNFEQARAEFAQALANPGTAPPLNSLIQQRIANSYLDEKNFPQARKEYEKLIEVGGWQPAPLGGLMKARAYLDIARSYVLEKNYAQAKTEYNKVLAIIQVEPMLKKEAEKQLKLLTDLEKLVSQLEEEEKLTPPTTP